MTTATLETAERRLLLGGDPDTRFPVPDEKLFRDARGRRSDFRPGPDIERIAAALLTHPGHSATFRRVHQFKVAYRWKRAGGASGGKMTLGKCVKASGLLREETEVDFYIWLGADTCREAQLTAFQAEALIYHQLLHMGVDEHGKARVVPHDFDGFGKEIAAYGLWTPDLTVAGAALEQHRLPLFGG